MQDQYLHLTLKKRQLYKLLPLSNGKRPKIRVKGKIVQPFVNAYLNH